MNTQFLVKQVEALTQEIREENLESRFSETSPDRLSQLQTRLDRLASSVKNPTLPCLARLQQNAQSLGLNTDSLREVIREGEEVWELQYA